jgi:hypothetical protein
MPLLSARVALLVKCRALKVLAPGRAGKPTALQRRQKVAEMDWSEVDLEAET